MVKERMYTSLTKLDGFEPWANWVPMPYPHKALLYAKQMYTRGEKLMVQTPDFVSLANDI